MFDIIIRPDYGIVLKEPGLGTQSSFTRHLGSLALLHKYTLQ